MKYEAMSSPVCPYCGHDSGNTMFGYGLGDGEIKSLFCSTCHRDFNVNIHCDYSYTTEASDAE